MKLAFITPVGLPLELKGDIFYILSHHLEDCVYYHEAKDTEGIYKLFDNSVHEGEEIPFDEYVDYAIDLKVDELVLQDVMNNFQATFQAKEKQLEKCYAKLKDAGIKIMYSVQGRSFEELLSAIHNGLVDQRIDTIGLSFTLNPLQTPWPHYLNGFINRMTLLQEIDKFDFGQALKPIHLLGANSWVEIVLASRYKWIRSCDSKLIPRLSKYGYSLDDMPIGKPAPPLDLLDPFEATHLLKLNQKTLKDYIRRADEYPID